MSATEKKHPDQARSASRRNQVLDAAECCFGRSGFHGASMAEISKAAGMSAGHIYNYFDSKDDIIAALVQRKVEHLSAVIGELAKRDDPLQGVLDDVEQNVRDCFDCSSWRLPLEIYSEAARNPKIAALLQAGEQPSRLQFRDVLTRARAQRGLPSDPAMLEARIEAIASLFQGLHVRLLHNPGLDEGAVIEAFKLALRPLLLS